MPAAVEVYADVLCPSAWVLLGQLVRRRAELDAVHVPVRVRAWPTEIVEGHRLDTAQIVATAAALREAIAPDRFEGLDPDRLPATSIPAMALTAAAYGRSAEAGESVALRLRELVFEEGVDVADPVVLGALEAPLGLHVEPGPGLVEAEYELGRHLGVSGGATLVVGEVVRCAPTFTIEETPAGLVARPTPWADEVLTACFAGEPAERLLAAAGTEE